MMRPLAVAMLSSALYAATALAGPAERVGQIDTLAQINTLADVRRALNACWRWPPLSEVHASMEFTVRLSFKRDGEIFGARITYQTRDISDEERSLYYGALTAALQRCSPLPFSESLGEAIAGRPLTIHIHDTRQQRKV